jgi:hypothetical protein
MRYTKKEIEEIKNCPNCNRASDHTDTCYRKRPRKVKMGISKVIFPYALTHIGKLFEL